LTRGYISKGYSNEKFIQHVVDMIEKQLQEWDPNYEVFLMKLSNYELMIKNGEAYYYVELTEQELDFLQNKSPFSLDRKIWLELENQGIQIFKGFGDYLDKVLYMNLKSSMMTNHKSPPQTIEKLKANSDSHCSL
jgi:hypothetical protein